MYDLMFSNMSIMSCSNPRRYLYTYYLNSSGRRSATKYAILEIPKSHGHHPNQEGARVQGSNWYIPLKLN